MRACLSRDTESRDLTRANDDDVTRQSRRKSQENVSSRRRVLPRMLAAAADVSTREQTPRARSSLI